MNFSYCCFTSHISAEEVQHCAHFFPLMVWKRIRIGHLCLLDSGHLSLSVSDSVSVWGTWWFLQGCLPCHSSASLTSLGICNSKKKIQKNKQKKNMTKRKVRWLFKKKSGKNTATQIFRCGESWRIILSARPPLHRPLSLFHFTFHLTSIC